VGVRVEDNDLGYKKILESFKKLDGTNVDIGFYGDGNDPETNMAERAAVNEYGTNHIPSRPFNRQAFDNNLPNLKRYIGGLYGRLIHRRTTPKRMFVQLGEWYKGKLQEEITSGNFVPNSPNTVAQKGSSRPLIDEGEMRRDVKVKISKGRS